MITIDPRAGSKDLIAPLQKRGLPIEVKLMEFGDVAFHGNGPGGRPVSIGVEVKKLSDLLSCISTSRFSGHQLPGMRRMYETSYLLVEGRWLVNQEGLMMQLRRGGLQPIAWGNSNGMQRRTLMKTLMTYEHCGGIRVRLTNDEVESVDWLESLYTWWTGKSFEQHSSVFGFSPPEAWAAEAAENGELKPWSLARQLAALLPGVGTKLCKEVVKHFPTVRAIADASLEQWQTVRYQGDKKVVSIGPLKAKGIVEAINGGR